MPLKKPGFLSKVELEVMEIFWDKQIPLTNTEICDAFIENNPSGIKTIHNITSRLVQKMFLKECSVVKRNKRFAQTYTATVSAEEYLISQVKESFAFKKSPDKAIILLLNNLLNNNYLSDDTLKYIQNLIDERLKGNIGIYLEVLSK